MFNIIFRIERWKWNKEYGYWVSTEGRVKNKAKKLVTPKVKDNGYIAVPGGVTIHRLVMKTWKPISNPDEMTIDHINHNKRDNSLANLEWVTEQENTRRATCDYEGGIPDSRRIIKAEITREELIKLGTLKPKVPAMADPYNKQTHVINERYAVISDMGRQHRCRINMLHRNEKAMKITRDQRKNSFIPYVSQMATFNKNHPVLVSLMDEKATRYFDNFEEARDYIATHLNSYKPLMNVLLEHPSMTANMVIAAAAEACLVHNATNSAGLNFNYCQKLERC